MQFWAYCRQYSTIKTFSFLDLKRHGSSKYTLYCYEFLESHVNILVIYRTRHKYIICQYLNKVMTD